MVRQLRHREIPSFVYDPSCVLYLPLWKRDGLTFMSDDAQGYLATATGATWGSQGRTFDGTDDKIVLPDVSALDITGNFTILFWVKFLNAIKVTDFYEGLDAANDGIHFLGSTTEFAIIRTYQAGVNQQSYSTNLPSVGIWYLLGTTVEGSSGKIWVNAVNVTTVLGTHIAPASSAGDVKYLGQGGGNNNVLDGIFGEWWIYNRALTAQEIQRNYLVTKWRYI